jgi:hypothetical protein
MDSEALKHVQWPAMLVTLGASWLVASKSDQKRKWGFWAFLLSNFLWITWGVVDKAYALIALQIGLAALNIRGAAKNEKEEKGENNK